MEHSHRLAATYKGVDIYEDYGFFHPAIDPTIESMHFIDILRWVDDFLMNKRRVNICYDIMHDYFNALPYLKN